MFGAPFGHGTLRALVCYFGTLFNNIHLQRFDNDGNLIQTSKVPLNYGPREKFLARADGDPEAARSIAIQLPRISFEIVNLYYDSTRARVRTNVTRGPGQTTYQYAPVPYNIDFSLSILVKNAQDGTFIIEQILPYFNPDFTSTLFINNDLNMSYDVPLSLNSVIHEDTYEGSFIDRRTLIWTLSFTMKAWLFGPTRVTDGGGIIKEIDLNFKIPGNGMSIGSANSVNTATPVNIQITPGQNANGEAVSWYGAANAAIRPETVNANSVSVDENWGFITDFTENIE